MAEGPKPIRRRRAPHRAAATGLEPGATDGLAAGALLSMARLVMKAAKGKPSELVKLKRHADEKPGERDSGKRGMQERRRSSRLLADIRPWPMG